MTKEKAIRIRLEQYGVSDENLEEILTAVEIVTGIDLDENENTKGYTEDELGEAENEAYRAGYRDGEEQA